MTKNKSIKLSELIYDMKDHIMQKKGLYELGANVIKHPAIDAEFYNILRGQIIVYKKFGYQIIQDIKI